MGFWGGEGVSVCAAAENQEQCWSPEESVCMLSSQFVYWYEKQNVRKSVFIVRVWCDKMLYFVKISPGLCQTMLQSDSRSHTHTHTHFPKTTESRETISFLVPYTVRFTQFPNPGIMYNTFESAPLKFSSWSIKYFNIRPPGEKNHLQIFHRLDASVDIYVFFFLSHSLWWVIASHWNWKKKKLIILQSINRWLRKKVLHITDNLFCN